MKKKDLAVKYGYQPQIEELTYPDGEVLSYSYDTAGQVTGITGYHYGDTQVYIADIGYDEYGQRTYIILGNNIRTDYEYDEKRRWLAGDADVFLDQFRDCK